MRGSFPYDGLTQSSFARGEANPYRVIVDSNTSIMDESMVADLEKWVRAGGTFVTLAQTGRSTPETPNAWPIARLTGYRVTHIDQLKPDGSIDESGTLQIAPDQKVFDASWNGTRANGLHLQRVAPDAKDLLMWQDGGVAAGVRRLGKGFVVQLGAKFTGANIFDRVEPGGENDEVKRLRALLSAVLKWRNVKPEAARLEQQSDQVLLRPAVTNNGLYDTYTLWNWSSDKSQTVALALKDKPAFAFEARDGKPFPVTASTGGARLENVVLQPLETRVFLTPRNQIASAPLAWFDLQRRWWRGATAPTAKLLPAPSQRFARDLTANWKFQTLDKTADATPMLAVSYNDQAWKSRFISVWNAKESSGRGVFRKTFIVPQEWNAGRVSLWLTSWFAHSFVGQGRVWLDGQEVKSMNDGAYVAQSLPALQAGSTHTLAVEAQSDGVLAGMRGQCWISYEPNAPQKLDLAGAWLPSTDGLKYDAPVTLPARFDTQFLRRSVFVDGKYRGQSVMITVDGSREMASVLINGVLMRRHHHMIGNRWSLNLTPFVKFGAENEIELVRWEGSGDLEVREVSLGFFDPKLYP